MLPVINHYKNECNDELDKKTLWIDVSRCWAISFNLLALNFLPSYFKEGSFKNSEQIW